MASSISLPAFSNLASNILNPDGTTIDQSFAPVNGSMFRNRIINGNFDIWQRATSHSANGYGSADRWQLEVSGTTGTMSRQLFTLGQTDVPNNPTYFSRHVVSSVAGASNNYVMRQNIENVSSYAGQTVTISFYAKADAAKPVSVQAAQYFGSGGSPSATVQVTGVKRTLSTSWARYSVQLAIPSISGKVLGTDNGDCLQIKVWMDAGSSFDARTDTLGQQSGTFEFSGVQIEAGSSATRFEIRPIGLELSLCQRYYYRPGWNSPSTTYLLGFGFAESATLASLNFWTPVEMRVAPTVGSSGAVTLALATYAGSGITISSIPSTTFNGTMGGLLVVRITASGMTAGVPCALSKFNSTTQYIDFSAEL